MKRTLKQLLETKGTEVWSIGPSASVYEAIEMLAEKGTGLLLVVDDGVPVGVVSERDYARKVILQGKSSRDTEVREIMTSEVVYGRPDQTIQETMALMTEKRFRHLPVLEGDRVCGIVSMGDLVKVVIADQQFRISQLEDYISS